MSKREKKTQKLGEVGSYNHYSRLLISSQANSCYRYVAKLTYLVSTPGPEESRGELYSLGFGVFSNYSGHSMIKHQVIPDSQGRFITQSAKLARGICA